MAAIRNLKLQFGMVMVDVAMLKATSERTPIEFKRLHKEISKTELDPKTGQPITTVTPCMGETGQKVYCKTCNAIDLTTGDFTKGMEVTKGKYIEFTDAELEALKVPTNGVIVIHETADESYLLSQPMFLSGQSYFLQPPSKEKYPPVSFALIKEGLAGCVGIGRTSMYGKENTVAIQPTKNGFLMHILRYPSELRTEPVAVLPPVDPGQLKMAKMVVDSMKVAAPQLVYPDAWADGVIALRDQKLSGVFTMPSAPQAPTTAVNSLEDQLKATLEAIKAKKAEPKAEEPAVEAPKGKKKKGKAA